MKTLEEALCTDLTLDKVKDMTKEELFKKLVPNVIQSEADFNMLVVEALNIFHRNGGEFPIHYLMGDEPLPPVKPEPMLTNEYIAHMKEES